MFRRPSTGALRDLIVIETPTAARTDHGGVTQAWATHAEAWARIDQQGGREFMAARAENSALTHEVTIRWVAGVKPTMRVKWEDAAESLTRYFRIVAVVKPTQRTDWLVLHCEETNEGTRERG